MTDAGRAPLAAVFVSLLAMLLPLLTGATPAASSAAMPAAKPLGPPSRTESSERGPPGATKAENAPKPEACDRECCQGKRNSVYRGDASCEGAFVRFVTEAEHALPPVDPANQCVELSTESPRRLVATLPDPLDTGMRATFDQGMEGLFAALEAVGLLRDRFWSPWHDSELADKEGPSAIARCVQRVPAVFTFRRCATGKPCELVELFVVGESATSGVAHGAAVLALHLAASRGEPVSVIGPTFSGTAASLREAMDAVPADIRGAPRFRATTGTASLKEVQRLLSDGDRITFSARVLSSEAIRQGFFRYLRQAMPDAVPIHENVDGSYHWLEHVALFTETGTSFGAGVQRRDSDPRASESSTRPDEKPMNASVVVHFPLHVGVIRASLSEQQGSESSQAQSIGGIPLHQVELHPGRDSAARRDTPSPLSNQTSTAEDLVLAEQVRVLEEEDIRVVGIFASDPVDALFLVRRLRERLPSAHLFVFQHDALFGHPENADALHGVMLVSTYPSTAHADRWMFPYKEGARRLMSSPAATGLYNAMLFGSGITPYPGVLLEELSLAYAPPFRVSPAGVPMLPSIWISAVGASGIVPVAVVAAEDDGYAARMVRTGEPSPGRHGVVELDEDNVFAGSGWRVWGGLFDFLFGMFAVGTYLGVSGKQLPIAMRWFGIFRRPRASSAMVWRWRLGATLAILSYWLATICLSSLSVPPLESILWKNRVAISTHITWLSWVQVVMQAVTLAIGAWSLVIVHSKERARPIALALPAIPVAMALYVQGSFFADSKNAFLSDLPLAYLRWTSLGSQLSPVIAIVAIFVLLIVGVANYLMEVDGGAKHAADDIVRVFGFEDLELAPGDPHILQARRLSRIQRLTIDCVSLRKYPFVVGVAMSCWGICVVVDPVEGRFATIEHQVITSAIGLSFLLALVTTAGGMSAMLTMAGSLTLLLRRIHAHPLGGRVAALGASFDFRLRLPFAALPDASGQVRCWLERARELAVQLPNEDRWRKMVSGPAVERILAAGCPNDVVGSIRAALCDEKPVPEELVRTLREAWAKRTDGASVAGEHAAAEQLAATNVLLFVFWCLRRLRTVAAISIASGLLFALGIASYPFEPARELATVAAVFVATALMTSLTTFVLLERDPLLSELTGGSPGKIDWDWPFIQQIITWVLLPFLAFLATKYPQEIRSLLGWATPFVHSK